MAIKILRRNKNIILETVRTEDKDPNKLIYPFILSKLINTDYPLPAGKLVIPIKPNTNLSGSVFVQAETPNIVDSGISYYSPMEIIINIELIGNNNERINFEDIYKTIVKEDDATKIIQIPVNVLSNVVGTKDKLVLIISARNLLPKKGYIENTNIGNIINIVYFEKKSQGE